MVTAPRFRDEIIGDIKREFGDVRIYSFEVEIYHSFTRDIDDYRRYLLEHLSDIETLYEALADPKSKDTLLSYLRGRITGDQRYFIDIRSEEDQYFPSDLIHLNDSEVIAELGSNNGETLLDMVRRTNGRFRRDLLL